MHDGLDKLFGQINVDPIPPFASRYPGKLESILGNAQTMATYQSFDVVDVASYYWVKVARRHAFIDGNKRAAVGFTLGYLQLENYQLLINPQDMYLTTTDITQFKGDEAEEIEIISRELKQSGVVKET